MDQNATLPGTMLPQLPAGYSWSVTDYLGFPDGDPLDPVTRKGQRVLVAIHRRYHFGFLRFSLRVGRVLAFTVDPRASAESLRETVELIYASFQRRLAEGAS